MKKRGATKDHLQKLKIGRHRTAGSSGRAALSASPPAAKTREEPPPLSHPIFCPPLEPVTEERREAMAELKKRMADCIIPHFADDHSYVSFGVAVAFSVPISSLQFRFLGARQWDVDRAETMMREAVKWRKNLLPIDKYKDLVSLSLAVQLSVVMSVRGGRNGTWSLLTSFFERPRTSLDERFAILLRGGTMQMCGTWTTRCA